MPTPNRAGAFIVPRQKKRTPDVNVRTHEGLWWIGIIVFQEGDRGPTSGKRLYSIIP